MDKKKPGMFRGMVFMCTQFGAADWPSGDCWALAEVCALQSAIPVLPVFRLCSYCFKHTFIPKNIFCKQDSITAQRMPYSQTWIKLPVRLVSVVLLFVCWAVAQAASEPTPPSSLWRAVWHSGASQPSSAVKGTQRSLEIRNRTSCPGETPGRWSAVNECLFSVSAVPSGEGPVPFITTLVHRVIRDLCCLPHSAPAAHKHSVEK